MLLNEYSEIDELVGKFRHTQHIRRIGYREAGTLRSMVLNWEDSGIPERPHQVLRAPLMVTVGEDGMRRIHLTRELDRYVELGAPFVKTGGVWGQVALGAPTRAGLRLQWTRPQANMYIDFGGDFIKMAILLKGGFIPEDRQIAFPVGMQGFTRQGSLLLRDGVIVAELSKPVMMDAINLGDIRPINGQFVNLDSQAYWLMTLPSLTGMTQPIIDPTVSLQPDETAGKDTYIVLESPTVNSDSDTNVFIGEQNAATATIRTLIQFDLSTLPDAAIISSATFSLYCIQDTSANARSFRVFRQKRAWVETEATWNIYSSGNNWSTAGGFHADDCEQTDIGSRSMTSTETLNQFKDWALTPTTKSGLDLGNGWLLKADTELNDRYGFRSSRTATAAERPKFVVVYTLPAPKYMYYQRLRR
jgi:hypothetical protein